MVNGRGSQKSITVNGFQNWFLNFKKTLNYLQKKCLVMRIGEKINYLVNYVI
jgi:hypothetical protein